MNNVGTIDGQTVVQNSGTSYVTPTDDGFIYNANLKQTNKVARAGKKVKVDEAVYQGSGEKSSIYFRIAGTKGKNSQYLYWGDTAEYPDNLNSGKLLIRFPLADKKFK